MKQELFRKSALDTVSSPEQLDRQVAMVRAPFVALFSAFVLGIIVVVIFGTTYQFTDFISAGGVIFTSMDVVNITSDQEGIIQDVLVKEGEYIQSGDIIAVMENKELFRELEQISQEIKQEKNKKKHSLLEENFEKKKAEYLSSTIIKSNTSGYIQSVKTMGSIAEAGETIASLMSDQGYYEFIAYVPLELSKSLSPGMEAQVSPSCAPREEYGYINGVVTSISSVPATEESMVRHLGTLDYVDDLLPDAAVVEVRIKLSLDTESQNGYQWSNSKGNSLAVGLGSQCSAQIVTKKYPLITLLFS